MRARKGIERMKDIYRGEKTIERKNKRIKREKKVISTQIFYTKNFGYNFFLENLSCIDHLH